MKKNIWLVGLIACVSISGWLRAEDDRDEANKNLDSLINHHLSVLTANQNWNKEHGGTVEKLEAIVKALTTRVEKTSGIKPSELGRMQDAVEKEKIRALEDLKELQKTNKIRTVADLKDLVRVTRDRKFPGTGFPEVSDQRKKYFDELLALLDLTYSNPSNALVGNALMEGITAKANSNKPTVQSDGKDFTVSGKRDETGPSETLEAAKAAKAALAVCPSVKEIRTKSAALERTIDDLGKKIKAAETEHSIEERKIQGDAERKLRDNVTKALAEVIDFKVALKGGAKKIVTKADPKKEYTADEVANEIKGRMVSAFLNHEKNKDAIQAFVDHDKGEIKNSFNRLSGNVLSEDEGIELLKRAPLSTDFVESLDSTQFKFVVDHNVTENLEKFSKKVDELRLANRTEFNPKIQANDNKLNGVKQPLLKQVQSAQEEKDNLQACTGDVEALDKDIKGLNDKSDAGAFRRIKERAESIKGKADGTHKK